MGPAGIVARIKKLRVDMAWHRLQCAPVQADACEREIEELLDVLADHLGSTEGTTLP